MSSAALRPTSTVVPAARIRPQHTQRDRAGKPNPCLDRALNPAAVDANAGQLSAHLPANCHPRSVGSPKRSRPSWSASTVVGSRIAMRGPDHRPPGDLRSC
jgi:hypothetical protein